ncbi:hypothetical protein [Pseudovibrio sp. Tun.PSC04-5.I4]|uniref:DUF5983 family protein n=1 Tax=Pseudovibrio sp. Tun.PSC04-5.I4 TaxID=1798213 RepID=UPI00087E1B7C|nr:hypothetical protein [Pseudovibrio sp. Tun.PSC04-5.I4]SDR45251.1 hypothetical protein SAMN04515695_5531 [Pseudovibrio sp. Tun.PSC04-5.I4]
MPIKEILLIALPIFLVVGSIGAYALLLNDMRKRHRVQGELVPPQNSSNAPKPKQEQPVGRPANVLSVLDLSTAHLSPQTLAMLSEKTPETFPLYGGNLMNGLFVSACRDYDYNDKKLPIDLLGCLTAAWAQDCSHILFDCDGPIDECLFIYSS